jgi:hypothetical protein
MVTGNCDSTTATPKKFSCEDFGAQTGDSFQVSAGSFSGTVARDGTFTVTNPGNKLAVTIASGGSTLQEMEIETKCKADEDLTVGKTFGGLQLVGFVDGSGSNTPIVEIVNQYIVYNPSVAARTTRAEASYTLNGQTVTDSLISGEVIPSKATSVYEGETVMIDLSQSNSFSTTFELEAEGAESEEDCGPYTETLSFTT